MEETECMGLNCCHAKGAIMPDDAKTTIEKTENGIAWTDDAGKRHEYRAETTRGFYLQLQELKAGLSLTRYLADDEPIDAPFTFTLSGKALLEDRSIQVIGDPGTASKDLDVSIQELTAGEQERIESKSGFKQANLFYFAHDWEIGNAAGWSACIYLPPAQFQPLKQAWEAKQIAKFSIGLRFEEGAYVDDWYAPPSARINWFIAHGTYSAKSASGHVSSLNLEKTAIDLRPPMIANIDSEEDFLPEAEPPPSKEEALSAQLNVISQKLEGIYKHLGWIFWAIVAVAVWGKWH